MRMKRIVQLQECPGWTEYLCPRIADMIGKIAREALENENLTPDKVMLLRAEAKALRNLLGVLDTDMRVSRDAVKRG